VDYSVNPALGVPEITGAEGSTDPVAHAVPAWDLLAGNLCVSSLLAAERHRLRNGVGQDVELSLKDVAAAALGHLGMIGDAALNDAPRTKAGNALYGAYGQDFVCKDGERVMVIGLTDRQWRGLVKITYTGAQMDALAKRMKRDLMQEGARWELRHEITEILKPWFAARPIAAFEEAFKAAGLTWSQFRSLKAALAEDQDLSAENPMFTDLHQTGLGRFPVPSSPVSFSEHPREAARPAPQLGMHTEEILGDVVGMDDREISRLFDRGIVQSPNFAVVRPAA
jgi:2-methylfumaryl-CoA isomerase